MTKEQFEREARYQEAFLLVENLYEKGLLTAEESRNLMHHFEDLYQPCKRQVKSSKKWHLISSSFRQIKSSSFHMSPAELPAGVSLTI